MAGRADAELADILERFRVSLGAPDSPPVHVAVKVARRGRFLHEATGASGQVVWLDEPAVFGGGGAHADPAEHLLAAVGASLSVTLTAHAALRGLSVSRIDMELEADLDERSFFAPRKWPRAGLQGARITLAISGALTDRQARSLVAEAVRAAPVLRSLKRRPALVWTLAREAPAVTEG